MSKGSWPRKVKQDKFAANYERIFGDKKKARPNKGEQCKPTNA